MNQQRSARCVLVALLGFGVFHVSCLPVRGQSSQRGASSRGMNPLSSRSLLLRTPVILRGAQPPSLGATNNAAGNNAAGNNAAGNLGPVNTGAATNRSIIPNVGGYYFGVPGPAYLPYDLSTQNLPSAQNDNALPPGTAGSAARPNVRPRLDTSDRDAMRSLGEFQRLRHAIVNEIKSSTQKPFTPDWHAAHPKWPPLTTLEQNAYQATPWSDVQEALALGEERVRYDFRPDQFGLIFVYRNGARQQRAVDARAAATALARQVPVATDELSSLSLGVFAAISPVDQAGMSLLHLALDRSGAITGYRYQLTDDSLRPLGGTVNQEKQLVAWRMGETVTQVGLQNLTQDVARALVFEPDGWTRPWTLLRIPNDLVSPPDS